MTCRLPSCPNEAVSVVTVPSQRGPFDCAYCDRHTLAALRAGATMTDRAPDEHANTPTTDPAMPATPSDPATVQTCSAPDCSRPVKARALCSKHYDVAWKASRAALAPASAPVIGTATGTDASADRAESVAQVNDGASDDLLRLRNNLRSAMGIPVADGSDARIVETVRTLVATNVLQDGAAAFDRRIAKGEIDTLREQLAVSERHRLATIADREQALNERDEARAMITPASSDELAALRKQVAELSFGASSWHKAHAAGQSMAGDAHDARARSTVAILLDGLESVCDDDLERATVRAIRAALGLDGVLPVK